MAAAWYDCHLQNHTLAVAHTRQWAAMWPKQVTEGCTVGSASGCWAWGSVNPISAVFLELSFQDIRLSTTRPSTASAFSSPSVKGHLDTFLGGWLRSSGGPQMALRVSRLPAFHWSLEETQHSQTFSKFLLSLLLSSKCKMKHTAILTDSKIYS